MPKKDIVGMDVMLVVHRHLQRMLGFPSPGRNDPLFKNLRILWSGNSFWVCLREITHAQGINFFPVRDCKAGRRKRSSSKATAGISGKYSSGTNCQKITGRSGNHYGKYCCGIHSGVFSGQAVLQALVF